MSGGGEFTVSIMCDKRNVYQPIYKGLFKNWANGETAVMNLHNHYTTLRQILLSTAPNFNSKHFVKKKCILQENKFPTRKPLFLTFSTCESDILRSTAI